MASDISNHETHKTIKRIGVIVIPLVFVILIAYLVTSALAVSQYSVTLETLVGSVYTTLERDLAFNFEKIDGEINVALYQNTKNYDCLAEQKDNVIYLLNENENIYKELVLISDKKIFSNQDSCYVYLYYKNGEYNA